MHVFMVMFSFMMLFYFTSFIKTELVTKNQAVIIDSYEKIMATNNLKPKFLAYDSVYKNFETAKSGSTKHRLWMRSLPHPLTTLDKRKAFQMLMQLNRKEVVLIGNWMMMAMVFKGMCPVARHLNHRPLILRSAGEDQTMRAAVYNKRSDRKLMQVLVKRMTRTTESGILHFLPSSVESSSDFEVKREDVRICAENRVQNDDHPQVLPKSITDFEQIFINNAISWLLSTVILFFEVIRSKWS